MKHLTISALITLTTAFAFAAKPSAFESCLVTVEEVKATDCCNIFGFFFDASYYRGQIHGVNFVKQEDGQVRVRKQEIFRTSGEAKRVVNRNVNNALQELQVANACKAVQLPDSQNQNSLGSVYYGN